MSYASSRPNPSQVALRCLLTRIAISSWIVFFFQAEDGIRVLNVTGVQTCALPIRSEEHTSELQSHSEISYAVFCLKKKSEQMDTIENSLMTSPIDSSTSKSEG